MERCFSGAAESGTARSSRTLKEKIRCIARQASEREWSWLDRRWAAGLRPARQPRAVPPRAKGLPIEGKDRQSAEKLGVEVGGFLGHDFPGEGDVADLRHAARIHQENNIGATGRLQVR